MPSAQKARARIRTGAFLLVACAYAAVTLGSDALRQFPPPVLFGFAGVAGFGLLLFIVGLRAPMFPVEFMAKFWSAAAVAGLVAGSWWLAISLPDVWRNVFVRGVCISLTVAQAIDFLLLLRPMPSGAIEQVNRNIAENEFNWD